MDSDFKKFIIKHSYLKAEQVKPELRLAEDMGFYGLDAITFFEEFFSAFNIKNAEDFDAELHIDGGPDFVNSPIKWLKNVFNMDRKKYLRPDVTLGHLQKVKDKGEWFNEV